MASYKAIIFDLGGVCVGSPLEEITEYEKEHGILPNYINVAITKRGEHGAFQRLERGELGIHEFYKLFSQELSDPINMEYYKEYLISRARPLPSTFPKPPRILGQVLFRRMMSRAAHINPVVFHALKQLRVSNKYKLAALTNNFTLPADEMKLLGGAMPVELARLFDLIVESSVVGLRKPDPKIFLYACEKLQIMPNEAIFLDDIGMNCKAARDLGMTTIKVDLGKSAKAIETLERLVGIPLLKVNDTLAKL